MNRLRQYVEWLTEPPLTSIWACGLGLLAAFLIAWIAPGDPGLRVRIAAFVLQGLGIFSVAWQVRKTREFFGHDGLVQQLLLWFARRPTGKSAASGTMVSAGLAGMEMKAHAGRVRAVSGGIEDRVAAIEADVVRIDGRVDGTLHQLDKETKAREAALKHEQEQREASDKAIAKRFEDAATGGLNFAVVGVVWLIVGVFLGTFPDSIVGLSCLK